MSLSACEGMATKDDFLGFFEKTKDGFFGLIDEVKPYLPFLDGEEKKNVTLLDFTDLTERTAS